MEDLAELDALLSLGWVEVEGEGEEGEQCECCHV